MGGLDMSCTTSHFTILELLVQYDYENCSAMGYFKLEFDGHENKKLSN